MKVLVTGGSGFVAGHMIDVLLSRGHTVVTTVRSEDKAKLVRRYYPEVSKDRLSFVIVPDIAKDGAFDKAVVSDPHFDAVFHPASPILVNVRYVQKELLDPAVKGTTGILKSVQKYAPSVKRVVVTSSFAAVWNRSKGFWPGKTYTEKDWADVTGEEALTNPEPTYAYQASKKEAEQAAWDFMQREKPHFDLTVIIPPMVYGPVKFAETISQVGSNGPIAALLQGQWKDEIPETRVPVWTDVRDVALAHMLALDSTWAANRRILCIAGTYTYRDIVETVRQQFADEYGKSLPGPDVSGGHAPEGGVFAIDSSGAKQLGLMFTPLSKCIGDLVRSMQPLLGGRNQ